MQSIGDTSSHFVKERGGSGKGHERAVVNGMKVGLRLAEELKCLMKENVNFIYIHCLWIF